NNTIDTAEIFQDGVDITNNGDLEIIGRKVDLSWLKLQDSVSYTAANQVTIIGDKRERYKVNYGIKFVQKQAFTNNPSSGSDIELVVSSTDGFAASDEVFVRSSQGREKTTIQSLTSTSSITVNSLDINHD